MQKYCQRKKSSVTPLICILLLGGFISWLWNSELFTETFTPPFEQGDKVNIISGEKTSSSTAEYDEIEWNLILINEWNRIPNNYEVSLSKLSNGESVDTRILSSLQDMFDTAREDGIYPVVASGYRTEKVQKQIMEDKIASYKESGFSSSQAKSMAKDWVATPGTSEHQLGIAVDINGDRVNSTSDEVYSWLNENSHLFGFIRRYPPDKTEITGINNEPWHYRYVGIDAATEMSKENLCLEEYLEQSKAS